MLNITQKNLTSNVFLNKYLLSDIDFDDIVSIIVDEYDEGHLTDKELEMIFSHFNVKENIGNYSVTTNRIIYSLPQYSEWIVEYEKIQLSKSINNLLNHNQRRENYHVKN